MDHDELDHDADDGLTERTGPSPADDRFRGTATTTIRSRAGLSVPGALVGVLLIGAVAFGANLVGASRADRPDPSPTVEARKATEADPTTRPTDKPAPTEKARSTEAPAATKAPKPTDTPAATPKPEPKATAKPTDKPKPKPTDKPEPKATPKPTEKPATKPVLELALAIKEGIVVVKWSACGVDGAEVYKIVRSTDSKVAWPTGDSDELIAAVGLDGERRAWDKHAPSDAKVWYRVFCVRHGEDGYRVLAASATRAIETPKAEPKPTPKPTPEVASMWLEAEVEGGAVTLHWEACGSDGFSHYRVIRKVGGDGQVIAEIGDAGTTTYVDTDVSIGETVHYAVQAKGTHGDDWVLLGATDWVSVTVE